MGFSTMRCTRNEEYYQLVPNITPVYEKFIIKHQLTSTTDLKKTYFDMSHLTNQFETEKVSEYLGNMIDDRSDSE